MTKKDERDGKILFIYFLGKENLKRVDCLAEQGDVRNDKKHKDVWEVY